MSLKNTFLAHEARMIVCATKSFSKNSRKTLVAKCVAGFEEKKTCAAALETRRTRRTEIWQLGLNAGAEHKQTD